MFTPWVLMMARKFQAKEHILRKGIKIKGQWSGFGTIQAEKSDGKRVAKTALSKKGRLCSSEGQHS